MQDDVAFDRAMEEEKRLKGKPQWDAKFQFEFIEWMEKYWDETGHYPPPLQCYIYIMNRMK